MFERYTEKARRVIFFALYEARQVGSPYIETEHLLLGLVREAHDLVQRFNLQPEAIREQIEKTTVIREKINTTVDLPLSNESKRVLAYAAEAAERLSSRHIGTEHLLLGLLREKNTMSATLLAESGLNFDSVLLQFRGQPAALGGGEQVHRQTKLIAFIEDGKCVATAYYPSVLPRIGEEIVLEGKDGVRSYVAQNVRYVLEGDAGNQPSEVLRVEIVVKEK